MRSPHLILGQQIKMKGVILALSLCFQLIAGGIIVKNLKKSEIPEPPPATEPAKLARFVMFYSGKFQFNHLHNCEICQFLQKKGGYIFFIKAL